MRADAADDAEEAVAAMLARMAPVLANARGHAQTLDAEAQFPTQDIAALTEVGALSACVPRLMGGLGIGTESARATAAARLLHDVGGGSVALGRIIEGHINAIRLVLRNGNPEQRQRAAADACRGQLHALWVTDGADPLRYTRQGNHIALRGEKAFCSAAGHATRAVVTATNAAGERLLLLLPLGAGEQVCPLPAGLQGVRSAATGRVRFDGATHDSDTIFGEPETYLREPEFSAGAWRASAVAAGALAALVDAARAALVTRGRADNPEQRQRLGRMFINATTARLWLLHAAPCGEAADANPLGSVATVNLARIAIEFACVDTIQLVQRSLGLSAFLCGNPVERMCRDLATYLRQPAPDEALHEAAGFFCRQPAATGAV